MKILHCINSPNIGGIERLVIELAIEQKRQGIDVSILLNTEKGQYFEYLLTQNIPILESGIKGGLDISVTTCKALRKKFNTFQIIHLHSFSPIRNMAAKVSKAKVVYTIHGLSKDVRKENVVKYAFREAIKKRWLNKVDYFIANSESTLSKAKLHYGLEKTRHKAILNGISIKSLSPTDLLDRETEFTIGMVSRFTPRKRIERLLNAFDLFLKKGLNGRLILVGDGINFNDIKQQVELMNLEHVVDFVGYTNDVNGYYKQFHICVQPSDNEGFGLVAVEAYLHGLPMLAFNDSGGLMEVVAPLEPNNIVKNEVELAERLSYYFHNKQLIADNSKSRIAYATKNFCIERMERDYFEIYQELVK
ncbi:MAG: glycosyltransferase involved in cell wall biosynthesis [Psychroserpens sp.]|jgi:glycosyltransferase involved in cell wall biosynthesis|uniref:glycosyltransferase family 4 protein n=1 Tax=Psychroserpens sp. TaxID=2020870 RepID=UPI0039E31BDC